MTAARGPGNWVVDNPGEKNCVIVVDPGVTTEVGDQAGIVPGAGCEATT